MGNSTLPTACDKLNIMSSIHNRKLIAALVVANVTAFEEINRLSRGILIEQKTLFKDWDLI